MPLGPHTPNGESVTGNVETLSRYWPDKKNHSFFLMIGPPTERFAMISLLSLISPGSSSCDARRSGRRGALPSNWPSTAPG